MDMATGKIPTPIRETGVDLDGFNVTIQHNIGRVEFGKGNVSPYEAAFQIIARHGEAGTYRFPGQDGGEIVVIVEHPEIPEPGQAEWREQ